MKCRTCTHCAITSRTNGYCHGQPPAPYFARLYLADGDNAIVSTDKVIQLVPSYLASAYPPVNPTFLGCRLHRFSIFTWLRWRFGKETPVLAPVEQKKP